jgi:O-antigen/teichoic acid export membrane protein
LRAEQVLHSKIAAVAGRLGWGLTDQALSSLTNFALGILVARSFGSTAFGAYSLAFATYLVTLNVSRGLATDPFVIRYSGTKGSVWQDGLAAGLGMTLIVGLVSGIACLLAGLAFGGVMRAAFFALGLTMPGLILQDTYRLSFFALARGGLAVLNDLLWAVAQFLGLALLIGTHQLSVFALVLVWGGAATVASVAGGLQAGVAPKPARIGGWLREHRDLALRYLGENLTVGGTNALWSYGVGAIAGVSALGSLQAARLLIAPLNVLYQGVSVVAVPEAIRVLRLSARRLLRTGMLIAGGLGGATLAWGVAMLLLPTSLGVRLLGPSWTPAHQLLLPMTLLTVNLALTVGALVGLRALGAASRSLRARLVGSALILGGVFVGAAVGGAPGAAWGHVIGSSIAVVSWWRQLAVGVREYQVPSLEPATDPPRPVGYGQ